LNLLVTGGAGFIGSHVVERLLADGHTVVCIDDFDDFYSPEIKRRNLSEVQSNGGFRLVEGDIRDDRALEKCFSWGRVDGVIHLAARAGVRPSLAQPDLYYDVNVMGTLRLLEKMRRHEVSRMLFASSSSVYGENSKIPFTETDDVNNPVSPYAASKRAGELLCHTYHHLYRFDIFCLRFFTVYGPRQRPDMAIHKFAVKIMRDEPITVYGDGTSRRDYTFIEDIVQGITKSLGVLGGFEIVNLGESRTVTLNSLIDLLEKIMGKKAKAHHEPRQSGDVEVTYADVRKARNLLGYEPGWPIENGLNRFVDWLESVRQLA